MMERISNGIKRQPVVAVYLLAFAFTWLGWVPQTLHARGVFPFDSPIFYVLGGAGPLLAVYLVLRALHGEDALGVLFAPFFKWRVGTGWYAVALLGYPALWVLSLLWAGVFNAEVGKLGPLLGLVPSFFVYLVAAVPEEAAWRGFALPRLQARYGALIASLIVGLFWALWHLPLLLNPINTMSTYPLGLWIVAVLARSVHYAWLFNSTRGSLLIVTLYHAAGNVVGPFVGIEQTAVEVIVAVALVAIFGVQQLTFERRVKAAEPRKRLRTQG